MFFGKIPRGVQGFQEKLPGGGGSPYFGFLLTSFSNFASMLEIRRGRGGGGPSGFGKIIQNNFEWVLEDVFIPFLSINLLPTSSTPLNELEHNP
jgi:hypothetical protein